MPSLLSLRAQTWDHPSSKIMNLNSQKLPLHHNGAVKKSLTASHDVLWLHTTSLEVSNIDQYFYLIQSFIIHIRLFFNYMLIWKDLERLERTFKVFGGTWKELKELWRNWKDLYRLQMNWKVLKGLERTWKCWKALGSTWKWLKGLGRTLKYLKGLGKTWKDKNLKELDNENLECDTH